MDRLFKTRTIVYGWAFYFGATPEQVNEPPWTNVCILCGTGHASSMLLRENRVVLFENSSCPSIAAINVGHGTYLPGMSITLT